MTLRRFEFDWDLAYRIAALPFGITPRTAWVELSPAELQVRFGWWRLRTAPGNVVGVDRSEDYAFVKTAGPPHLSFADHGVTFATNGRAGLCLRLREPVAGIDPTKRLKHPGVTLTVAEPAALASALGFALE